jgi:hypothetical protein
MANPLAGVSLNSQKITSLGTPSANTDAATKGYVDGVANGLDVKASVRAATTANITLSGTQTIDTTVSVIAGDRVLVKNQTTGSQNGIYVVAAGAWTRSTDADADAEVTTGLFTFVEEGTTNGDTGWVLATNNPITVGTTSLTFSQFSDAGSYTAGTGLTLTGNQFSVTASTYQPLDTELTALAGLTSAADALPYFTGSGTASTTSLTSSGRTVIGVGAVTGTGSAVLATSPTLTTPVISSIVNTGTLTLPTSTDTLVGRATTDALTNKTSYNKVAITAPATSATLTIADGKTLTASNTLTLTGTDASSVAFGSGGTVLYSGGALGTPSSGTLTNASGLPISGITASTSAALGVGSIELGHATDTTLARVSAGVISGEGKTIPRMYNELLTGTGTSFPVAHGLGAVWVTVMVYDVSTGKYIIPDHTINLSSGTPTGTVTITFPASVTGSNYRVVITG